MPFRRRGDAGRRAGDRGAGSAGYGGELLSPVVELGDGHDVVDEADPLGLDSGHGVAGEEVLLGPGRTDGSRP